MSARRAAALILSQTALRPSLGIVLGTGFHQAIPDLVLAGRIGYADLPGFPPTGVPGHPGEVLLGVLGGTPVIVLNGRAHHYEGHDMERVTHAVRVLGACGVQDLLLTNAAGGLNRSFKPGDFMMITDHINMMGASPLRGPVIGGLPRFVDLTRAYDATLGGFLRAAGRLCGLKLRAGVYLAVSGPHYETPAEIRAFARLGADAVGMSTVPEVIVARQLGMRVAALSCITNLAAGRTKAPLTHAEVLETAGRSRHRSARILQTFARVYGREHAGGTGSRRGA